MTKELLLHEYMLLERKNEALEEKLEFMRGQEEEKARRGLVDYNFEKGECPMDPETAQKINVLQLEISRLHGENERLQQENSRIKDLTERLQEDHDSSSSSSSSEDENEEEGSPDCKKSNAGQGRPEDTGYESTAGKDGRRTRVT